MANELQAYTTTGKTLYAVVLNSAGAIWMGGLLDTPTAGNWTDYDIPLTESTAGLYSANFPSSMSAGIYNYIVFEQAGASPAITDTKLGIGYVNWDGSAILPLSTIDTVADAILVDTGTTIPGTITTIDNEVGVIDGIVDDILVDTGTTLPATLTTMEGKIDTVDGLIDSIMGATWSDEDLVAIKAAIDAVSVGSGASAEDVWTYASRELSTPDDYKADVSDLALEATVDALENVSAADIWGYSTRTLTNQGTSVESPATGDPLEIYRDTTVVISLTSLGDVSGYTNIWFTAKEDPENEADSVAVIQIDMTTGLLYIDGVAPTAAAEGSIVFSSETAGDCTITIAEEAAADLPIFEAYPIDWDIKMLKSGVVSILSYGTMYIYATPTRTIV